MTYLLPAHSFKMNGLVLASYRTDSMPCSRNACALTAAHACTSPQPTLCLAHGCWNLQGIAPKHRPPTHGLRSQGRAHVSTPPGGKMARQNLPSAQWEDGRAVPGNPSCKLQQGLVHDSAGHILANNPQPLMPACNQSTYW